MTPADARGPPAASWPLHRPPRRYQVPCGQWLRPGPGKGSEHFNPAPWADHANASTWQCAHGRGEGRVNPCPPCRCRRIDAGRGISRLLSCLPGRRETRAPMPDRRPLPYLTSVYQGYWEGVRNRLHRRPSPHPGLPPLHLTSVYQGGREGARDRPHRCPTLCVQVVHHLGRGGKGEAYWVTC